jgi:hypothetical protein
MKKGNKSKPVLPIIKPLFKANSELARYVPSHYLMKGGRVSSAAFLRNPGEDYLSVNSVEIESLPQIAEHYRRDLQKDDKKVALASVKILTYNQGALKAGISVFKNNQLWVFSSQQSLSPAYLFRKTHLSASHCGIEFIRAFPSELAEKKFAWKVASAPKGRKPHLL